MKNMKCKTGIFFILSLAIILMMAGCGIALHSQMEEDSMTDEYVLYPRSNDAWVGDVMPFATDDALELFYLYDTDHNGSGYHPIHKFTTNNFFTYSDEGCMVKYGDSSDSPDRAIGTGSVLIGKDNKWHCFYTGHNDFAPSRGEDKECVMHAISEDGINWTKVPEDTFYSADNYSSDDFRDPFVFWNEEEKCYWLLIAAREEKLGGVVAKYVSADLKNWELCEPLFAPQKQYMLECPDIFKMGDYYYLFYSWDCVTYYAMSDSINGPFVAPKDNVLDGTGFCFYAAKTAEFKGERYLCGWVGRKFEKKDAGKYDWAGNLVIHQLTQLPDGRLGVKAPDSLDKIFVNKMKLQTGAKTGNVTEIKNGFEIKSEDGEVSAVSIGERSELMSLEFDVILDGEGYVGVGYGSGDNFDKYAGMVLDSKKQSIHYEGCVLSRLPYVEPLIYSHFNFESGKTYHVKMIMENEIVITYINDEKALSTRVYKSEEDKDLVLYACKTGCKFENVEIKKVK